MNTYEYYCKKIGFNPLTDNNKTLPKSEDPDAVDDRPSPFSQALEKLDYDELTEFEWLYKEELEKLRHKG